mgnify:CR=1 FL=1
MTIGQIPWTAIDRYCDAEGVVDRERFRRLIRALDTEFLRFARGKSEDEGDG